MTYLRSLFLNFLTVFFINNIMPGINISSFEFVPNIGKDILFSLALGFLNASIFPILVIFDIKVSFILIFVLSFVVSFLSYGSLFVFDFGIKITNIGSFLVCSFIVWVIAVFSNYLEHLHAQSKG